MSNVTPIEIPFPESEALHLRFAVGAFWNEAALRGTTPVLTTRLMPSWGRSSW